MDLLNLEADHLALSLVRIVYHLAVLWLLLDLWLWREVAFFGGIQTAVPLLILGLAINVLLVVGLHTRPLAVVNCVLLRLLFHLCLDPYTVDEVVENFSFIFMFAPRPRRLSLDSRRQGTTGPIEPLPRWFTLLAFTSLELLYSDSVLYKLRSEIWLKGSAFWLGARLAHFAPWWSPGVPEIGWLMKACTWGALAYEMLFPLVLLRSCRIPVLITGLLMHLGTAIFLPLPQFGLVMIALLLLFLPGKRMKTREAPPSGGARRWTSQAGYALSGLMVVSQLLLYANQGDSRNALSWVMGTYRHPIFIDWHFRILSPLARFVTSVDGVQTEIPSFDSSGRPTTRDRYWKTVGFSMRTQPDAGALLERYLVGWFRKSGLAPRPVGVFCRDVFVDSLSLDFGTARKIEARPWTPCGVVSLEGASGVRPTTRRTERSSSQ